MKGTNADKAKAMIVGREEELGIYFNDDFDTAASYVVDLAKKRT